MKRRMGFTLVEIMIVVAIIGLLAAIAIPAFMRARDNARKSACINNIRMVEQGKDSYATEKGGTNGVLLLWDDICPFVKDLSNKLFCPAAIVGARGVSNYSISVIGVDCRCLIIGAAGGHCGTNAP